MNTASPPAPLRQAGERRHLLLAVLLLSLAYSSPIKIECSPRTIQLGDVITYKISMPKTLTAAAQFESSWPATGNLTLLGVTDSVVQSRTRLYYLTAFTLDKAWVPSMRVQIASKDYVARGFSIKVNSAFEKNEQKKFRNQLKPQASIPIHWGVYLLAALIVTLIGVLVTYIFRRFVMRKKTQIMALDVLISPFERANQRLDGLDLKEYQTEDEQKQLMFGLSHVIREYAEATLATPVMEQTTYEIGFSLPKVLSDTLSRDVVAFLSQLDPVKYAKDTLSANELRGKIQQARDLLIKLENRHVV